MFIARVRARKRRPGRLEYRHAHTRAKDMPSAMPRWGRSAYWAWYAWPSRGFCHAFWPTLTAVWTPLLVYMHVAVVLVIPVPHVTEHCEGAPRRHWYVTQADRLHGVVVVVQLSDRMPLEHMLGAVGVPTPALYWLHLGIADGMSNPGVWACRYSK